MDAFEQIVAGLLRQEGYWTWNGYKVNLTKAKKVELGKPSLPRPEIDILAYQVSKNRLLWVECKSYLDSRGVLYNSIAKPDDIWASHFKVFTQPIYRQIVSEELIKQVISDGLVLPNPTICYCLITGHIASDYDRVKLHQYFVEQGWILYDEKWLKERLHQLSMGSYENDVTAIVAKILRGPSKRGKSSEEAGMSWDNLN